MCRAVYKNELVEETHKDDGATVTTYRNDDTGEFYYKRTDYADQVYKNPQGKFKAVANEIKQMQELGRPILVGTIAIETYVREQEIRLFEGRIGCGTCHDPFSKLPKQLVMSNKGSRICLACHDM